MKILFNRGDIIENIALVLGGGGAKGAYQIGVINALHQFALLNNVTAISGASIGALNMALIQAVDILEATNIWLTRVNKIFFSDSINIYELMNMLKQIKMSKPLKKTYLYDRKNLIKLFDELNIEDLAYSNKYLFANCVDMTDIPEEIRSIKAAIGVYEKKPIGKINYFTLNNEIKEKIYKILLASSAIPLVFESVEINNRYYVDGGLIDNLPIKPLYDCGYRNIIAIACDKDVSLNNLKMQFPYCNLYLIKPNIDLGDLISGTLNFSKKKVSQLIKLGYRDGMNLIKKIDTQLK